MTEKRADYRRNERRKKLAKLFHRQSQTQSQSQTKDDTEIEDFDENSVDVNPDFKRENLDSLPDENSNTSLTTEEKVARLKKRLNWAIVIVLILIVIVLWALFKL